MWNKLEFQIDTKMSTEQGPRVALLSPPQSKEPPLRGGVHLRTVANIVEPAKGKRGTSAGWLVSAADVGDDGREKPRLHAVGKVPTVAAIAGQPGPEGGSDQTHEAVSSPVPYRPRANPIDLFLKYTCMQGPKRCKGLSEL